ncbi:hypothetical protein [Cellvibrio sp. pealriver]|uniref:hypothetical protein n=1 Tax=Cellvibrio sp. pealriver TaxID=1622269 RepID=UPI00066FCA9E|nr:hypothetical protein [Cellvibrio sp. pealriver]
MPFKENSNKRCEIRLSRDKQKPENAQKNHFGAQNTRKCTILDQKALTANIALPLFSQTT